MTSVRLAPAAAVLVLVLVLAALAALACSRDRKPPPGRVAAFEVQAVRARLRALVASDQNARRNRLPWSEIDRANVAALKEILGKHGWPTISVFGRDADRDAWLLVQHADHDPAFQKEVLAILARLKDTGETSPANYAYLYDRAAGHPARTPDGIRVQGPDASPGGLQRYGTQGQCAGGRWEPFPIEDPARVDERRKSVGLGPLEEYRRLFRCR
jgi:hypothetical protein